MKRQEIVDEARRFVALKTRWSPMGRNEKRLDCYGLIILVRRKFGLSSDEFVRYGLYPEGDLAMDIAIRLFDQVHPPLKPGMVIVFQDGGRPWHTGIYAINRYGQPTVIHCAANHRVCTEEPFEGEIKAHFRAAFDLPGVED